MDSKRSPRTSSRARPNGEASTSGRGSRCTMRLAGISHSPPMRPSLAVHSRSSNQMKKSRRGGSVRRAASARTSGPTSDTCSTRSSGRAQWRGSRPTSGALNQRLRSQPRFSGEHLAVGRLHERREQHGVRVARPRRAQQGGERVRLGLAVVVHEPDPVRLGLERRPQAVVEALGAAAVPREPDVGEREPLAHGGGLERLGRAVGRGGVHHGDPVERMRLACERLQAREQQLAAVVRDHHRVHAPPSDVPAADHLGPFGGRDVVEAPAAAVAGVAEDPRDAPERLVVVEQVLHHELERWCRPPRAPTGPRSGASSRCSCAGRRGSARSARAGWGTCAPGGARSRRGCAGCVCDCEAGLWTITLSGTSRISPSRRSRSEYSTSSPQTKNSAFGGSRARTAAMR